MNKEASRALFGEKTALALGGALVAGYALFTALAAADKNERPRLERIDSPTALGDPVAPFITPEQGIPAVTLAGTPLYAGGHEGFRDEEILKAGMDDTGKIPLYRLSDQGKGPATTLLRAAPRDYILLLGSPVPGPRAKAPIGQN